MDFNFPVWKKTNNSQIISLTKNAFYKYTEIHQKQTKNILHPKQLRLEIHMFIHNMFPIWTSNKMGSFLPQRFYRWQNVLPFPNLELLESMREEEQVPSQCTLAQNYPLSK